MEPFQWNDLTRHVVARTALALARPRPDLVAWSVSNAA